MNKTVNINLANRLFHIDEGAYLKMQRYLESVKRSFANTPGSDEILADIEARIAELFYEKLENERQVITQKEVDEVIAVMGQPEDYIVDEDIFEDEPRSNERTAEPKRSRKLYRDTDQKYVAGVSSGLAHYFNIDSLWIRLLWIILTIGSSGGFILIYGLLWLLVPEAVTTSQKLDMRGEDVNISNIERKVKEGFDDVAQKIKSVDYEGVGNRVKSSGKTFFDTVGDVILFLFKIIGKFIGILLIIIGASTIIGLFIGMITVGIADAVNIPGLNLYQVVDASNMPIWFVSLLGFFAIGIPFFFLLYLGLKILVNNLKSIGSIAKFSLLGLWLISIILLIVFGVRQATARAYSDVVESKEQLVFQDLNDTLSIDIASYDRAYRNKRTIKMGDGRTISRNEAGEEVIVLDDVQVYLEKSKDTLAHIEMIKESDGSSFDRAEELATAIVYDYEIEGNTLFLNDFITTPRENRMMDQEIRVNLMLPEGTVLDFRNESNYRCWRFHFDNDRNLGGCDLQEFTWKMGADGELECQGCPESEITDTPEKNKISINKDGVDIDIQENGESFKLKINKEGINLKAKENENDGDNEIHINREGMDIDLQGEVDSLN
ncbi:phage shock protein C (PspC) family protein [Pricia antarctica]|uniref:Phage shock protein C (PspC) family protein n=1 Tax=Pricia antarctica TaxID=641691 RepID=A0A1G7ED35_9FLAO|nr:PspC domain-containing protein [Pricia antarctica]SDE61573.1 phage shock protein C (PspC) family protein [Pricia antarctica]